MGLQHEYRPEIHVGYEAAHAVAPHRDSLALIEHARQSLRAAMLNALRGERNTVPHVEHRVSGDVVKPCPIGEAVAEAMHLDVVGKALLSVLRFSHCPDVVTLRETIASAYANEQAPLIVAIGGEA
jgi:hypothetical protein